MKLVIFALILLIYYTSSFSQEQKKSVKKPVIDLSVMAKFSAATRGAISGNGNYVIYTVENPATSTYNCYVKSLKLNWTLDLGRVESEFTADSKYLLSKNGNDSLAIMQLENRQIEYIPNVSSFRVSNNGKWISYCEKDKKFVIKNLETRKEKLFEAVTNYFFKPNDSCVFIESNQVSG